MHKKYRYGHFDRPIIILMTILFVCSLFLLKPICLFKNCERTKHKFLPTTYSYIVHNEEFEFPLAFNVLVYRDFDRAWRLIQAIHRPHNAYCIHVDKKVSRQDYEWLANRAHTFGNVYLVPRNESIDVAWGYISVIDAELKCARLLFDRHKKWRYLINLTGQEFPLRTNWELVKVIKILNGSNLCFPTRLQHAKWRIPKKKVFPFEIKWTEGYTHVALRREFVDYMLHDPNAIKLYELLRDHERQIGTFVIADELFFTVLNHNPDVFPAPGAYTGNWQDYSNFPIYVRYKIWNRKPSRCYSRFYRHQICMLGLEDSVMAMNSTHLFANKFSVDIEPEGYELLEEWIATKVAYEAVHHRIHPSFKPEFYEQFDMIRKHL